MTQNKPAPIAEAYKEILQIVKTTANAEIKTKEFVLRVKMISVNPRVYGGCKYIKSIDDQNAELQLIVPADMAKTLEAGHCYEVRGSFEVSALPSFGFFQFRVAEANQVAADSKLEAKKQTTQAVIEKVYLPARDRSEIKPSKAQRVLGNGLESPKRTYQGHERTRSAYTTQTYDKPRAPNHMFGKSQAGSLLIYAALFVALAIVAGVLFFAFIPRLFEAILTGS